MVPKERVTVGTGDKTREATGNVWKLRLSPFDGTTRWESFLKHAEVMFQLYGCTEDKMKAFKIVESLRGKAMDFFGALPRGVGADFEGLCRALGR